MRQTVVRRERNIVTKKHVKLATKAFQARPTAAGLSEVHSALDTAVKKNVLNKATAARRKAALSRAAKAAGVSPVATVKKAAKKPTTATKTAAPKKKTTAKKPATKTTRTAKTAK